MSPVRWLGIVLLALTLTGLPMAPLAFHAAWLVAWWFALSIIVGAMSTGWIHRLTGGHWGEAAAPAISALARRLPWVVLAAIPWLTALPSLYAWASPGGVEATTASAHGAHGFKSTWLALPFFSVRLALYAVCWLLLARLRPEKPASKGRTAFALLAHAFVTSLASVDILMSLMPRWYSTGFGLVILVSQAMAGWAMVIWWTRPADLAVVPRDEVSGHEAPVSRDMGNLMLMYVMSWGYLAFMQFLIIWAENLPNEIAWYLPRLRAGWLPVTLLIVALQLAVPLLALLFKAVKDRPGRLRALALMSLGIHALYCAWLVLPSLPGAGPQAPWLSVLALAGVTLWIFGSGPHLEPARV